MTACMICFLINLSCFRFLCHLVDHHAGKRLTQSKQNPLLLIERRRSASFNSLVPEANSDIVFDNVNIVTPSQKMLARKLSMRVPAGKSLLVTGISLTLTLCSFSIDHC